MFNLQTGAAIENPLIIYHANCPDGFASALSAWLHFEGKGEYIPKVHADALPDMTGRDVFMLDIAFSREKMELASEQSRYLVVLDHHASARDDLGGFKCKCGQVHFDLEKSAAKLSWEYFHPQKPVPPLIQHVQDRDLLTWVLEDSPSYLASLDVGPYNFHRWAGILTMPAKKQEEFLERGRYIYAHSQKLAAELADNAVPVSVMGFEGLMANAPNTLHNQVGEILLEKSSTFALMWCMEGGGIRVKVGLRGAKNFDVIPIARAFGGGGHPYASAFRLSLEKLPQLLSNQLTANA